MIKNLTSTIKGNTFYILEQHQKQDTNQKEIRKSILGK